MLIGVPKRRSAVAKPPESVVKRWIDNLVQIVVIEAGGERSMADLHMIPERGRSHRQNDRHDEKRQEPVAGANGYPGSHLNSSPTATRRPCFADRTAACVAAKLLRFCAPLVSGSSPVSSATAKASSR